ncbi:MAG: MBL fold metallo-hydrolase [Candidatus Krumholzibacteriia bacterium]
MKEMTSDELRKKLVSGERIAVVDIREADEYDDWHIHGSSNMPMYNAIVDGRVSTVVGELFEGFANDKPIVTVCRMGATSKVAAGVLGRMGYEAFSLTGGIRGWSNAWTEAEVPLESGTRLIQVRRNGKGCLSYVVGSAGKAAVVDPCLDASVYTAIAEREGLKITSVIETHVHADHISRARTLCETTGTDPCIPENQRVRYDYEALKDGQTLKIGDTRVSVIMTPGHTTESACYGIDGEVLLSGDTIFVEALGRPDLERGDAGAEEGARLLYESLHEKVLKMDPTITVCPAHTGAPIGFDGEPVSAPLGDITQGIHLLNMAKEEFIRVVPEMLGRKPPNFERVISINEGRAELGYLDPLELEAGPNRCAVGKPAP